jgi:hypothetical protein
MHARERLQAAIPGHLKRATARTEFAPGKSRDPM